MASNSLKVITGKVRLSYPELFKARAANEKSDPKFSTEILIPKDDTRTLGKIRAAQNAAVVSDKGQKIFGDQTPGSTYGDPKFNGKKFQDTLRDGDDPDENEGRPEREGHWFMNVRSSEKYKPGVVDKDTEPVMDQSQVYGGVYARVSMAAYPFSVEGNKGVSFGLNNVQVLGYGEPFGGGRDSAEDDFADDFEDDADLL